MKLWPYKASVIKFFCSHVIQLSGLTTVMHCFQQSITLKGLLTWHFQEVLVCICMIGHANTDTPWIMQRIHSARSDTSWILHKSELSVHKSQLYVYIQGSPVEIQTPVYWNLIGCSMITHHLFYCALAFICHFHLIMPSFPWGKVWRTSQKMLFWLFCA